jgi:ribonuclease HI
MIKIYTDGSCIGNPGSGGWAAIILNGDKQDIISGRKKNTTNNQMELMAAIKALVFFSKKQKIRIYTDSNYVKEGITDWIKIWEKNNWKTTNKKKVKNVELWIKLNTLSNFHDIEWKWVKAHSGDPMNNMVDKLARKAALI